MPQNVSATQFLVNRRRPLVATALSVLAVVIAAKAGLHAGSSLLVGWNVWAFAFLVPTGVVLLTSGEAALRHRARLEDEDRYVLTGIILLAVGLSFAAIVVALKEAKIGGGHGEPPWALTLSVSTLLLSWLVVQCLFTLHYTHRYFGDRDGDGAPDGGIAFPGGPPTSYRDFIYVAVCIGSTCQVSDFNITATHFRNLVTCHALLSFFFNTLVLALGINIIGNLMGQ